MTPGPWQILFIVILIFLLFGAGKLPRVMGDIAKGIKSFKKGMKDDEEDGTSSHGKPEDNPHKSIASSQNANHDDNANASSEKSKSEQG